MHQNNVSSAHSLSCLFLSVSHPSSLPYEQMKCCGWYGPGNWSENINIKNSTQYLYSCSCRNESMPGTEVKPVGLCEHMSQETPVYETVQDSDQICSAVLDYVVM